MGSAPKPLEWLARRVVVDNDFVHRFQQRFFVLRDGGFNQPHVLEKPRFCSPGILDRNAACTERLNLNVPRRNAELQKAKVVGRA